MKCDEVYAQIVLEAESISEVDYLDSRSVRSIQQLLSSPII